MIKNKLLRAAILSLAVINIISFAACSKKSTTSTSNGTTIYGKVTKVNGKDITITVGTWKGGQESSNQGTPPGSSGSNSSNQGTSSSSNPPAPPSNSGSNSSSSQGTSSNSNQSAPPSNNGSSNSASQGTPPDMLTLTKETKTITISDSSIIKKQSMPAPGSSSSNTSAGSSASLSDITVGSILKLTYTSGKLSSVEIVGDMNGGSAPGGTGGGSGSPTITGTGAYTKSGTASDQKISATSSNQSGIRISDGKTLTLTGSAITKSGKTTSEDESNFYGLNAGVVALNKSTVKLSNSSITTDADGANAAFAYGSGSTVILDNVTLNTSANSSRGLDATFGGTVNANKVTISTKGAHCAALATDRGEGTINVTNSKATSSGTDSPAIYSTGKITVSDSVLTGLGAEAMVIEGKNSITLKNCQATGTINNGVMMYQSTSGDAAVGTSNLSITGGLLTAKAGATFFITNTDAVITLNNTKLTGTATLIKAAATTRWGQTGSNGGNVTLTANSQTLSGNVAVDKISTAAIVLNKSLYTGTINKENTAKSVSLKLSKDSTWNVTGTSYLTSVTDADTSLSNIKDNGNTIYYDSTNSTNSWLNGKTVSLSGGGKLTPVK
ncbi:MAG: hypothetical protein LIR50_13680 [Bacillota bacterium]|nr:hypothetical protein [Bacillota bacterium]